MKDFSHRVGHLGRRVIMAASVASLCWAAAPAARADDGDLVASKGYLALGTFLNNSDFKVEVDGETTTGDKVDWNNTFGDKDVTRFRLDGVWRFNERHHMRVMYTDYSNTQTRTLNRQITWQDDVFDIGVDATARSSFTIFEAAYEYAFMRSEDYELAGTFGLHYTTLELSLKADVTAPGGGGTVAIGGPASVDLPLPVVGLHGIWRMGKDFYLDAHAQYFALSIDNVDGSILNYRAAVMWQPKKYVGIGVGYDSFNIDVDINKPRFKGSMDWTYAGPQIFYNMSF
jgi:hypothetical protein